MNSRHKIEPREWPQAVDEYMLYQMLAGGWPLSLQPSDQTGLHNLCERLSQWLLKALREAKSLTSWTEPNTAYESACKYFLYQLLDSHVSAPFIDSLYRFVNSIAAAGALNGMTQQLLKLTAPGVPDIYQGCEWWDFSFADPDNRRPVDFAARAHALTSGENIAQLLTHWRDGCIKQKLLHMLLELRNRDAELFAHGDYRPLTLSGEKALHAFAFSRSWRRKTLLVMVPRLTAQLITPTEPTIAAKQWRDTHIVLPDTLAKLRWKNNLLGSNQTWSANDHRFALTELLQRLPFAVLTAES
jgi:(1->4)-alpha-D-glucan 1-alpha-D-glucosylmutase